MSGEPGPCSEFRGRLEASLFNAGPFLFRLDLQVGSPGDDARGQFRGYVDLSHGNAAWQYRDRHESTAPGSDHQSAVSSLIDGEMRISVGDEETLPPVPGCTLALTPVAILDWLRAAFDCSERPSGWDVLLDSADPKITETLFENQAVTLREQGEPLRAHVSITAGLVDRVIIEGRLPGLDGGEWSRSRHDLALTRAAPIPPQELLDPRGHDLWNAAVIRWS